MNQRINPSWVKRFIAVAIMAAVVKSGMLVLKLFLPASGVDFVPQADESAAYGTYKPSVMFGLQTSSELPQAPGTKQTAVYRLDNLTLKGLYRDSVHLFIVVAEGNKDTLLSKGETYKGYSLVDIQPSKAIFEKGGRRYELAFKEDEKSATRISKVVPVVSENGFTVIKRKEISYYANNFDAIWENIKIQEVFENKKLKGFEVKWIKKGSVFSKMGLEEKDVITGINGKPVSSVSQVLKLYQDIGKIDNLTIDIKRNNKERQLDYAIYD